MEEVEFARMAGFEMVVEMGGSWSWELGFELEACHVVMVDGLVLMREEHWVIVPRR